MFLSHNESLNESLGTPPFPCLKLSFGLRVQTPQKQSKKTRISDDTPTQEKEKKKKTHGIKRWVVAKSD